MLSFVFAGFLAELFLPVLFMALLILIKSITTAYNSPNIAYYCGNTAPWYYNPNYVYTDSPLEQQIPFTCTQKPSTCDTSNYYQSKEFVDFSKSYYWGRYTNFSGYSQLGTICTS